MNATGVTRHSLDVPKAALAAENPLLGTWKLQSLVYKISTGDCSGPFGDHPQGYLSYALDGRMYAIGVFENRPKPRTRCQQPKSKRNPREHVCLCRDVYGRR